MGTAAPERCTPNGSDVPEFTVSRLEIRDVDEFIVLQDLFAEEHFSFTRGIYDKVSFRDWQLCLLCPAHILEKEGGREDHVTGMVKQEALCFQALTILKATCKYNGGCPRLVGYIMFQVQGEVRPKHRRRRQGRPQAATGPWVQVKQFFVRRPLRRLGCGRRLFAGMVEALEMDVREDIRLSVLDLNTMATRWYRSQGFVVFNLSRDFIGHKDEVNVIVYQEMRRLDGGKKETLKSVPSLFKGEVIYEEIRVHYPDNSGTFDVRVVGYNERERWHFVDSRGLSLWEGETFTDEINLNEFYRDGHVEFKRHLSLVIRDAEFTKLERRRAKAAESATLNLKRDLSPMFGLQADQRATRRAKAEAMTRCYSEL